ncbi:MAG: ABC transporter permease [Bacteroidota bacterium]
MIKNYLKIAVRNILKNKIFSLINISGLAAGLVCCAFLFLFIADESGFDRHFKRAEDIYRVTTEMKGAVNLSTSMSSPPLAEAIRNSFPEVEQVTRLLKLPGTEQHLLKLMENGIVKESFFEYNGFLADSTFFDVFSYPFLYGNPQEALKQPNSIVLSENLSKKYFGSENPLGRELHVENAWGVYDCFVAGVFKNNLRSHIPANFFISMYSGEAGEWVHRNSDWSGSNVFCTYLKLYPGTKPALLVEKFPALLKTHAGTKLSAAGISKKLGLERLTEIHLLSTEDSDLSPRGDRRQLLVLGLIGIFILLIACINYINLTTGGFVNRIREVGVRKILGALRTELIIQFLAESVMICFVSFLLALVLAMPLLSLFENFTGKIIEADLIKRAIAGMFAVAILAGLLAGSFPALYLASFRPVEAISKKFKFSYAGRWATGKINFLKSLVVLQFTISAALIIGMLVIWKQMHYLQKTDLGFDTKQKLILPLKTTGAEDNYIRLKDRLTQLPGVNAVSACTAHPGIASFANMNIFPAEKTITEGVQINVNYVDEGFIQLMGIGLKTGRYPSNKLASDTAGFGAWVLNESAVTALGYSPSTIIGKKFNAMQRGKQMEFYVVGVLKDYHFESLHKKIAPQGFRITTVQQTGFGYLVADLKSLNWNTTLASVKNAWQSVNPSIPFEYSFLDEAFQKNYEAEQLAFDVVSLFALIGIVISCLGLFGLVIHTMEKRRKEIGIRKVLGARLDTLIVLLSKDFLKLVTIAVVIASPIAWWVMNKWLEDFAYRVDISWWVFAVAGIVAILIALITISLQAIKAAIANPVKSLRTE